MNDESSYWLQLCELVSHLRCWVRITSGVRPSVQAGRWGQLLAVPTEGYLEAPGGPIPMENVEWVDVSTSRIKGGVAGRPLQMVDVKNEILAALRGTQLRWEFCDSTWTVDGIFEGEPVQVIRVANPRERMPAGSSH